MAVNYQQTDAATDCGAMAACSGGTVSATPMQTELVEGGTAGSTAVSTDVPAGATEVSTFMQTTGGVGATTWDSGNYTIRLNITTANSNVDWTGVWVCRVNSACTSQATVASDTAMVQNLGATGVQSVTVSGSQQTAAETDDLYVVCRFRNNHAHSSQTVGVTRNQLIDTPLNPPQSVSESASVSSTATPNAVETPRITDLPVEDGLVNQYDLQSDALSFTDGQLVSSLTDEIGGLTVTAASGNEPTFQAAALNHNPALDFNADMMTSALRAAALTQPLTYVVVFQAHTLAMNQFMVATTPGGSRASFGVTSGNLYQLFAGSFLRDGPTDTEWHVAIAEFNGASSGVFEDGVRVSTGDPGAEGSDSVRLGANAGGAARFDGYIGEVAVYDRLLTEQERADITAHLQSKWSRPASAEIASVSASATPSATDDPVYPVVTESASVSVTAETEAWEAVPETGGMHGTSTLGSGQLGVETVPSTSVSESAGLSVAVSPDAVESGSAGERGAAASAAQPNAAETVPAASGTQWYWSASDYAVGEIPTEWTDATSNLGSLEVRNDADGNYIQIGGPAQTRAAALFDPSIPDSSVEVWAKAKAPDGTDTWAFLRWQNQSTSATWTGTRIDYDDRGGNDRLSQFVDGTFTELVSQVQTVGSGTAFEFRGMDVENDVRGKWWTAGTAEPGAWQLSTTGSVVGDGDHGVGTFRPPIQIYEFGVGIQGSPAPTEPVAVGAVSESASVSASVTPDAAETGAAAESGAPSTAVSLVAVDTVRTPAVVVGEQASASATVTFDAVESGGGAESASAAVAGTLSGTDISSATESANAAVAGAAVSAESATVAEVGLVSGTTWVALSEAATTSESAAASSTATPALWVAAVAVGETGVLSTAATPSAAAESVTATEAASTPATAAPTAAESASYPAGIDAASLTATVTPSATTTASASDQASVAASATPAATDTVTHPSASESASVSVSGATAASETGTATDATSLTVTTAAAGTDSATATEAGGVVSLVGMDATTTASAGESAAAAATARGNAAESVIFPAGFEEAILIATGQVTAAESTTAGGAGSVDALSWAQAAEGAGASERSTIALAATPNASATATGGESGAVAAPVAASVAETVSVGDAATVSASASPGVSESVTMPGSAEAVATTVAVDMAAAETAPSTDAANVTATGQPSAAESAVYPTVAETAALGVTGTPAATHAASASETAGTAATGALTASESAPVSVAASTRVLSSVTGAETVAWATPDESATVPVGVAVSAVDAAAVSERIGLGVTAAFSIAETLPTTSWRSSRAGRTQTGPNGSRLNWTASRGSGRQDAEDTDAYDRTETN